jgi:cell division protein FtsB
LAAQERKHLSMRRINTTRVGKVNKPAPLSKQLVLLALLLAVAVWVAYAFAQEAFLNHQLNAQAADLRRQNAIVTAENDGYRRDILASSTGAAAGEDARAHGYARSDERVYVVGGSAPSAANSQPAGAKVSIAGRGFWESLGRWIANFWHR